MIAIVNVSPQNDLVGWNDYEVRINRRVITTFKHRREEGLAVCLEAAAKAVREAPSTHEADMHFLISSLLAKDNY